MTNEKVKEALDKIKKDYKDFTGKAEVNYKDGKPMDVNFTVRVSLRS